MKVTDGICGNLTSNLKWEFAFFICKFSQQYNDILRTRDIKEHASMLVCNDETAKIMLYLGLLGHAVAQLVEALRCKSEGRGFDSPWCEWNFSLT